MLQVLRFHLLVTAILAVAAADRSRATVYGAFSSEQSGVSASDGVDTHLVDTYRFEVTNTSVNPIKTVEFSFSGSFYTPLDSNELFRSSPGMPVVAGESMADSFFISDGTESAIQLADTTTTLSAAWVLPGTPVIPAQSSGTVLAYLAVAAGSEIFGAGTVVVDGAAVEIPPVSVLQGTQSEMVATPVAGSTLDFGAGSQPRTLIDAIGIANEGGARSWLIPSGASIIGDDADLFRVIGFEETLYQNIDGGHQVFYNVQFLGAEAPGEYNATLNLGFMNHPKGGVDETVSYTLRAVVVPEPSTVALLLLSLMGLAGVAPIRNRFSCQHSVKL
ncbi:PEP-CTERM sorting domain-containing protein [Aeoliella sp.]|uniref:PEP-CTERM sorting domain-containing protein n=1 Tax=Aeoliella sp. TaxID=2795800 RepID=UPI003CCBC5D0